MDTLLTTFNLIPYSVLCIDLSAILETIQHKYYIFLFFHFIYLKILLLLYNLCFKTTIKTFADK